MIHSKIATSTLLAFALAGPATAQSFSIANGTIDGTFNTTDLGSLLTGMTPGTTYTSFDAAMTDWTDDGVGLNWSSDVAWFLTDQPVEPDGSIPAGTTIHLGSGIGVGAAANDYGPTDLTWSGFFDVPFDQTGDLWFSTVNYANSSTFSAFDLTFGTDVPVAPTGVIGLGEINSETRPLSTTGTYTGPEVVWFDFTLPAEVPLDINSIGSDFDTEIAIYSPTDQFDGEGNLLFSAGEFLFTNDDIDFGAGITQSQLFLSLPAGDYQIALGGFDTTFGTGWNVNSTSTEAGNYQLNIDFLPIWVSEAPSDNWSNADAWSVGVPDATTDLLVSNVFATGSVRSIVDGNFTVNSLQIGTFTSDGLELVLTDGSSIAVTGDVAFGGTATLVLQLGGGTNGFISASNVTFQADADGLPVSPIAVERVDGVVPVPGDYTIITYTGTVPAIEPLLVDPNGDETGIPFTVSVGDLFNPGVVITITEVFGLGDANKDGSVNLLDLDALGAAWQLEGTTWAQADFNNDDITDLLDLDILGSNWEGSAASFEAALAAAGISIPEPTSVALLGAGVLLIGRRRRA